MVAGLKQRRRDEEERGGRAAGDDHAVRVRNARLLRDQPSQAGIAEMVPIGQQDIVKHYPQVPDIAVAHGGLGEIVFDLLISELLRRFLLDWHTRILHCRTSII
ncbi:hypothetical protein SDC9_163815 [bioreactor metagenome]|uniref:Uncharacterized protein n=1 Tax=bioreactor metagenome TaxID=1076179 RepID=A0A645FPY3_9ZZZZ